MIPLLSPKPFAEYSPQEYKDYVISLYREPEKAAPPAAFTVWVNKKGTPVIRFNRKEKFLTSAEVGEIAAELGWTLQATWVMLRKKKTIEIRLPERKR